MLFNNRRVCPYCEEPINNPIACLECAKVLKQLINAYVGKTKNCDFFTSAFIYKSIVRDAILNFKFKKNTNFCDSFCSFMAACIKTSFDVLVCVPTFEKEFNASKEIANTLRKKLKIKFQKNAIIKIKKTKTQHSCNFNERLQNLNNAFKANEKKLSGKKILICDDIITTGSTIEEMSAACKKAGAVFVGAIAVAISEKFNKK